MKKSKQINFSGKLRYLAYLLILFVFILAHLFAHRRIASSYFDHFYEFGKGGAPLCLKNLSADQHQQVLNLMLNPPQELAIINHKSSQDDIGRVEIITIAGDPQVLPAFTFRGQTILNANDYQAIIDDQILYHNNPQLKTGPKDQVIPYLKDMMSPVYWQNAQTSFNFFHSMNGNYYLHGQAKAIQAFYQQLASLLNKDPSDIKEINSFSAYSDGAMTNLYLIATILTSLALIFVILIIITQSYSTWSSLALLGWSKWQFLDQILRPLGRLSLILALGLPFISFYYGGSHQLSWNYLVYFLLASAIIFVYFIVCCLIASSLFLRLSPLTTIKKQYSLKPLYWLNGMGYLIVALTTAYVGVIMEGPINSLSYHKDLQKQWHKHGQIQVLKSIGVGNDLDSLTGHSHQQELDMWDWYTSFADSDHVYLANFEYFDQEFVDRCLEDPDCYYQSALKAPLKTLTVNPQYLQYIGLPLSSDLLAQINKGNRVYLYPETWSKERTKYVENFTKELDTYDFHFDNSPLEDRSQAEFIFQAIDMPQLFTWSDSEEVPSFSDDILVRVINPANIFDIEISQLMVNGLTSPLKFDDPNLVNKVTEIQYLSKFQLDDNQLDIDSIHNLLNQTKNNYLNVLKTFGLIALIFLAINSLFLNSFISIYRLSHYEELFVSYLMGITNHQRYRIIFIFWLLALIGQQVLAYFTHSKFASLLSFLTSLIFILYILFLTRESDLNRYKQSGKE